MSNGIIEISKMLIDNLPYIAWIEDIENKIIFKNLKYNELEQKDTFCGQANMDSILFTSECCEIPIQDEKKECSLVIKMIIDKNIELEKIKNENKILKTMLNALPEPIFYKNNNSEFVAYNKTFAEYYRKTDVDSILGKNDLDIYHDKEIAKEFMDLDKEVMESGKIKYYEQKVKSNDGFEVIEESIKIPIIDKVKNVCGIVGHSRDITERKVIEERLRYLSEIDVLTGLYNRCSFEEKIKSLNDEKFFPLGIIMGDANGLKLVNDTLGHLEGDKMLMNIAKIFQEVCNPNNFVFRWGGDEFIILLPNHNEEKCEEVIEEIKNKCEDFEHDFIEINIALGDVVKDTLEEDIYSCIRKVEEKVYLKKLLEKKSVKSTIMNSLKKSLEEKSIETTEHTDRVTEIALKIGKKMNLKISELDELTLTCQLHDIGKIGISEEILLKPEALTEFEFELMKTHAEKGYRIINASTELGDVAKYVLSHHENWDGSGYPLGLKMDEIPLISRIVSVADAFDVMTHDRPYKKAKNKDEAIQELEKCAGKQFDYNIVQHLKNSMK